MYLNDPEDASSVKNNIKYAKLKSNVSLSLSLMSELKISFLINCAKHQADVNSSNVGSFTSRRQLNLQIMLPLPSTYTEYWNIACLPSLLLLFSTQPAQPGNIPARAGENYSWRRLPTWLDIRGSSSSPPLANPPISLQKSTGTNAKKQWKSVLGFVIIFIIGTNTARNSLYLPVKLNTTTV